MISSPLKLHNPNIYCVRRPYFKSMMSVLLGVLLIMTLHTPRSASAYSSDSSPYIRTTLDKISSCLQKGEEAVLFASRQPECFPYKRGSAELDDQGIELPHQTDYQTICAQARIGTATDQRVLKADVIKALATHLKNSIDSTGFRIIGGIYCEGLDLKGLHVDQSIILDRSVFAQNVDLRNFRTKADFSINNSAIYKDLNIMRAEIDGSTWVEFSSINKIIISDSIIHGALKIGYSVIIDRFLVESTRVDGDVDVSHAYFSYASIVKNELQGMLDFGQSQARCSYDIRSNEIGGIVATNFGFGIYEANLGPLNFPKYFFTSIAEESLLSGIRDDPLLKFTSNLSKTSRFIEELAQCEPINSIAAGSFIFVDNRVKNSLCLRTPRWLKAERSPVAESNLYLNENTITSAMWLDFSDRFSNEKKKSLQSLQVKYHTIRMFNINANTLIINFDFDDQNAELKINGLSFKRIYNSAARCEASVSLRASKPLAAHLNEEFSKTTFPPDLKLPSPRQVLSWIERNSFKATQPFAEFVTAFQQAGDLERARTLKASAAMVSLTMSASRLFCLSCFENRSDGDISTSLSNIEKNRDQLEPLKRFFANLMKWFENTIVVLVQGTLWLLADHGFGPERIGWFVLVTLGFSVIFFHAWLKIVGFSTTDDETKFNATDYRPIPKIHPIGFIFLFDHLLPAYKIRNKDYNISDYYVQNRNGRGLPFSYFGVSYTVNKATSGKYRKAERFLAFVRFLGLIYFVFILAAISRIFQ